MKLPVLRKLATTHTPHWLTTEYSAKLLMLAAWIVHRAYGLPLSGASPKEATIHIRVRYLLRRKVLRTYMYGKSRESNRADGT